MSASGFTPIQLYRSSTAATLPVAGNLAAGELAINTTDEKLYFENTGGTVTLLASSAAAGGTFTTVTATTVVNGLGAVGTPSYTFTGDLNTGMWSPAADTLAFSEGGVEAMRITSAGNVGIATTTPSRILATTATNTILAVNGSVTLPYEVTGAEPFRVGNFANTNFAAGSSSVGAAIGLTFSNWNAAANGNTVIQAGVDAGNGGIIIQARQSSSGVVSNIADFGMTTTTFSTNNTERMRISSAGLVGIGTSSPVGRLMVAAADTSNTIGSATASINITNTDAGATGRTSNLNFTVDDGNLTTRRLATISAVYTGFGGGGTEGALAFATQFNGSLSERMRISSAGLVGIGNTAPNTALDVSGSITSRSGSVIADTLTNYGANLAINAAGGLDTIFQTNGTERMRLTTGGNVGIGTTAPAVRLELVTTSNAAAAEVLRLSNPGTGANTAAQIKFLAAATNYGTITGGYAVVAPQMTFDLPAAGNYVWQQASVDKMVLDSSGNLILNNAFSNVLTGATSQNIAIFANPSAANGTARLELYGTTAATNAKNAILRGDNVIFSNEDASETMRIDSSGNVGVGTSAPATGSMSNVAILNAGMFTTFRGAVTAANNTATTIAVASSSVNATYIVCCGIASADPVNFSAVAIVSGDLGVLRVTTLQTANLMAISVSGTNIRATQNAGGAAGVDFSITRIS